MKRLTYVILLLAVILFVWPIADHWLSIHPNGVPTTPTEYTPPEISALDATQIKTDVPAYAPVPDVPTEGTGHIVLDLYHGNNLRINDLTPLLSRLEARGATVVTYEGEEDWETVLRGATSVLIMAPTIGYSSDERQALVEFVEDGGQVLMAADPTRQVPPEDLEFADLFTILFPESAIPAINSVASAFNLTFYDDYLYSLDESQTEGNYRNLRLTELASAHPLMEQVDTLVFFAAHSLSGAGIQLAQGNEAIESSVRRGEDELSTAILTEDEQVLALGDLTMLTAPYHTQGDNDRFLSHIADWLAVDERERDLRDFPYLFTNPVVDVIQTNPKFLDPRLITQVSLMQSSFESIDLDLRLSLDTESEHDQIYIGTFDSLDVISPYLTTAGISITLAITETEALTETDVAADDEAPSDDEAPADDETAVDDEAPSDDETSADDETATDDEAPSDDEAPADDESAADDEAPSDDETPADDETATDDEAPSDDEAPADDESAADDEAPADEASADDEEALTDEEESSEDEFTFDEEGEFGDFDEFDAEFDEEDSDSQEGPKYVVNIEGVGNLAGNGTSLFLLDQSDDQSRVIVLAEDGETVVEALNRLVVADFEGCILDAMLIICSSGEVQEGFGLDEVEEEEVAPIEDSSQASIFIMSDDDGLSGSRTGASDWQTILGDSYNVTVWSNANDGLPTIDDLLGHELYIIDSGDYEADPDDFDTIFAFIGIDDSSSILFIGAQPLVIPTDGTALEPILDIEVSDDTHPVAEGLFAGEQIVLEPSESDVPAVVIPDPEDSYEEASFIFNRGPDSPEPGTPVLIAAEDTDFDSRSIIATFAFYRLPEPMKTTFALNSVAWLLDE